MSKKSKRQTRKDPSRLAPAETVVSIPGSAPSRSQAFNPDYSYIIKDLRRIGVLALTFVAILVVLALVVPNL